MGGDNEQLLISLLIFISLSLLLLLLYILKKNPYGIYKTLNSQPNIIFISSIDKALFINSRGLKFFSCRDVDDFNNKYNNLANFFIEEKDCINKHSNGKRWIEYIYRDKNSRGKVKIKIKNDTIEYYFYLHIGKIRNNRYIISFTDITTLEKDKELIRKTADYDALTGIYNRVKFNDMLPHYINRALKYNEQFSIILFDIDHFKMINDTYGHNIGDIVLVELTALVKSIIKDMKIRQNTLLSRWGGEEFVILLQSKRKKDAYEIAQSIRKEVYMYSFNVVKRVTCSFGVTDFRVDDTETSLFHRVDNALYRAKDGGRNRVIVD